MRTTMNIDDRVLEELKEYARARTIPTGEAASELLKMALRRPLGIRMENGWPVNDVPEDSPIVTLEQTLALEDEL